MTPHVWRLKKGSEKKFRSGHPWIFSNELAESPKGLAPGALVELRDHQDSFLGIGYGHPNSLISFRRLSTDRDESIDGAFFARRLSQAAELRRISGLSAYSHRLCFAEGDGLPGLIIDRFVLFEPHGQVFVVQCSTAGMDVLLPQVLAGLEQMVSEEHQRGLISWELSAVIIANDAKSRTMEGLAAETRRFAKQMNATWSAEAAQIAIEPGLASLKPLVFTADLIGGQKTGFFLDQRFNVGLALRIAQGMLETRGGRDRLRVLDLCCYAGQWGAQLAHLAAFHGLTAEVTAVDASAKALELAVANVERHGGRAKALKLDVLNGMGVIENRAYDVVICDPPAFIKKKKDLPTGSQAYFKMNREALRKAAPGALFVSCSCSGLFTEEDFREMLARASAPFEGRVRWLARGGHSMDHPQRPEFPQGTYLKSWLGRVP